MEEGMVNVAAHLVGVLPGHVSILDEEDDRVVGNGGYHCQQNHTQQKPSLLEGGGDTYRTIYREEGKLVEVQQFLKKEPVSGVMWKAGTSRGKKKQNLKGEENHEKRKLLCTIPKLKTTQ